MYSYSQTGPLSDHFGSSWDATAEGQQYFHDYSGAHSGEPEEYATYVYGAVTPPSALIKAEPSDAVEDFRTKSSSAKESSKRVTSRSPGSSSKRRSTTASSTKGHSRIAPAVSQLRASGGLSTGNASPFRSGSQTGATYMEASQGPYLDANASLLSSTGLYQDFNMDMDVAVDSMQYDMSLQHLDPVDMHLDPHAHMMMSSPPNSFSLTPPQSPPNGYYLGSSPSDVDNMSPTDFASFHGEPDTKIYTMAPSAGGIPVSVIPEDSYQSQQGVAGRRPRNEGETARDHQLYKTATPQADGLYHCPFEGQTDCHHKPEKLKCNYDKFVDSHLRPYRCKVESCENARFSSTACLLRHEREAHRMHGHQVYKCAYESCERSLEGKGFPRAWNLKDHMRRVHNDDSTPPLPTTTTSSPSTRDGSDGSHSKSRRREKTSSSSSKRKSSKSTPVVDSGKHHDHDPSQDTDDWYAPWRALKDIVVQLERPDNLESARHHLKRAQKYVGQMYDLHEDKYTGYSGIHPRRSQLHGD